MSNVIKLKDRKATRAQAREQAGLYLAQLDRGASAEELREMEYWLAEHELHRETFLELARLWDDMSSLASLSRVFPLEEYYHGSRRPALLLRAASVAVVAIGALLLYAFFAPGETAPAADETAFTQHYETEIGDQRTVVLADGSEFIMNTSTVIDVRYTKASRNVFLNSGEGYFTVAADADRPFRVYAGERIVEAVGTAFSVHHASASTLQVVVTEGKVNVHRVRTQQAPLTVPDDIGSILLTEQSVALEAGEEIAAASGASRAPEVKSRINQEDIDTKLAWTSGMLVFRGESLENVLREVSRYTTIVFEADENIKDREVQGYFRAGDIDGLLVAMKRNFNIEAMHVDDNRIQLYAGE